MRTTKGSLIVALRRRAAKLSAIAFALAVVMAPTASHAVDNSVALAVPAAKGGSGATVSVPITLNGAADVGALHVELTFDPSVLEPQSAERGRLASSNSLVDSNPQPGRLTIGLVTSEKINGNGEVLVAKFKVLGKKNAKSALTLENVKAWQGDVNRFDVKVNATAGEFTVTGKKAFPWWIVAVAAAVLIAGFIYLRSRSSAQRQALAPVAAPGGPPQMAPSGAPPMAPAVVWFYVDAPEPLMSSDGRQVSVLQPGTWYRSGRLNGEWMEATDASGNTGWINASKARSG
jgi:Cohesin domain